MCHSLRWLLCVSGLALLPCAVGQRWQHILYNEQGLAMVWNLENHCWELMLNRIINV